MRLGLRPHFVSPAPNTVLDQIPVLATPNAAPLSNASQSNEAQCKAEPCAPIVLGLLVRPSNLSQP